MKNVISIGVNNTSGLTPLSAAASGAVEFDNWAKSQGYVSTLFTDLQNKSVLQNDIFIEINRIIEEKTCEQLIIFFSGHGILRSPNQEVWLLSNAKNNPNESINLTGSIDYARTTGIPYIVFISDACRILPTELQFTGNGSVIFPIYDDTNQDCAVDILYATRPGSPANEYNSKSNSKKFGIFTRCLLDSLNGKYPAMCTYKNGNSIVSLVDPGSVNEKSNYEKANSNDELILISRNIKKHLPNIFNETANEINIHLQQFPELRVESDLPLFISKFSGDNFNKRIEEYNSNNKHWIKSQNILYSGEFPNATFHKGEKNLDSMLFYSNINPGSDFAKKVEKIFDSKGRESFETQTGFTIIGNEIADVIVNEQNKDIFFENGVQQIRVYRDEIISSALVVLRNGQSIPIAVLKGFIGTLVFDKDRLLTINYTPSRNNYKYYDFQRNEGAIKFVRAYIASAANEGFDYQKTFENEFNKDGHMRYDNPGSFLRREKSLDPSLGLYAVYAYMQAGKTNDVKSVYRYMREESDNMLFDVAMLSGKLKLENNRLAPFCPMLSLGWAYRKRFEEYLHPQLLEASNFLVPTLWTTFDEYGTELVIRLFKANIIK